MSNVLGSKRSLTPFRMPIAIGVNPGGLGVVTPQILGRGVAGGRGRVVKYYILSCTECMFESGDFCREIE